MSSTTQQNVKSIIAISKVLGDGRKVFAVIIEYDSPICSNCLNNNTFSVVGKDIIRVYSNTKPETSSVGSDGPYVVIELRAEVNINAQPKKPTEADMQKKKERDRMHGGPGLKAGWSTGGDDEYPGNAFVIQNSDIKTTDGKTYQKWKKQIESTVEKTLVADDFQQQEFMSPFTGQILPYNIYIPKEYSTNTKYPLVLFIHDAGVASAQVKQPLYQGNGATSWAEEDAQNRHKCVVVAPEYPVITVDDNWNYSHHLDATIELLKDLQNRYSIDPNRIYTTGQSMGCMSSIVMMLKNPDIFAGALLVAGKWNSKLMGPLSKLNIWIISCEGDRSSNTLQGEAVELWRKNGSKVTEATWNMQLPSDKLSEEAEKMRSEGNHLLFTHLTGGNHRATWFVAYGIKAVQDWLFDQHK
ncbi:hypothetical protein M9Y10_035926 [Tritrichomonas musculus]|uniref:Esterase Ig-like N-terminal domain-containing protein n=1 Tax=Tritrichomonas musculus TaxID=1915356 RepID=A0ABR2GVN2_9EUKA